MKKNLGLGILGIVIAIVATILVYRETIFPESEYPEEKTGSSVVSESEEENETDSETNSADSYTDLEEYPYDYDYEYEGEYEPAPNSFFEDSLLTYDNQQTDPSPTVNPTAISVSSKPQTKQSYVTETLVTQQRAPEPSGGNAVTIEEYAPEPQPAHEPEHESSVEIAPSYAEDTTGVAVVTPQSEPPLPSLSDSDNEILFDDTQSELPQKGFTVLPDNYVPLVEEVFTRWVDGTADESDMFFLVEQIYCSITMDCGKHIQPVPDCNSYLYGIDYKNRTLQDLFDDCEGLILFSQHFNQTEDYSITFEPSDWGYAIRISCKYK